MNSIFSFSSYRDILKLSSETHSLRALSQKLGFKSSNYLSLVLAQKRNLSIAAALRYVEWAKLGPLEGDYFVFLVLHNDANDKDERKFFDRKLNLIKEQIRASVEKVDKTTITESWRDPILALLSLQKSPEAAALDIANQLDIKPEEARLQVTRLLKKGLLKQDSRGSLDLSRDHLSEKDTKASAAKHRQFIKKHIDILGRATENHYGPETKHSLLFLAGPAGLNRDLHALIDRMTQEAHNLTSQGPCEDYVVLHFHALPLGKYK